MTELAEWFHVIKGAISQVVSKLARSGYPRASCSSGPVPTWTGTLRSEGDGESWYREWLETAERVHGLAEESRASGHTVSAREAHLRASNCCRTSEFRIHANSKDERHLAAARRSRGSLPGVDGLK